MEIWKLVEERKNYLRVFEEKSANCHKKRKSLTLGRDRWHLCSWSSDQRQGQAPTLKPSEKPGSFTLLRLHFLTLHLAQTVYVEFPLFSLLMLFALLSKPSQDSTPCSDWLCYSSSCSHCLPFGLFTLFRTLLWLQIKLIRKNLNFFLHCVTHITVYPSHTLTQAAFKILLCTLLRLSLFYIISLRMNLWLFTGLVLHYTIV